MKFRNIIEKEFGEIILPFNKSKIKKFKHLDCLALTGEILVCRDMVHKKIAELCSENKKLPVSFENSVIFYAGPSPTPANKIIGAIGPTTSSRMDCYVELMLKLGVNAFIGKGQRSAEAMKKIRDYGAVYLITFGGYAALLSQFIEKSETIAFAELGAEALLRLTVKRFPVLVYKN
ncbi:MAG TPA: FumA C-terminus/TtdB family hydratase beta subunit [bacterium]|nr:FumA C-terminus/TtdB family hydratase beta subunit [bacterium]